MSWIRKIKLFWKIVWNKKKCEWISAIENHLQEITNRNELSRSSPHYINIYHTLIEDKCSRQKENLAGRKKLCLHQMRKNLQVGNGFGYSCETLHLFSIFRIKDNAIKSLGWHNCQLSFGCHIIISVYKF